MKHFKVQAYEERGGYYIVKAKNKKEASDIAELKLDKGEEFDKVNHGVRLAHDVTEIGVPQPSEPTVEEIAEEIEEILEDWENDDIDLPILEKAMEYFCSNWDKSEGFKHAILLTVHDQVNNHLDEQNPEDFKKLLKMLK